jgi:hypothetical protein
MEFDGIVELLVTALQSVSASAEERTREIDKSEWSRLSTGRWQRPADVAALDRCAIHEVSHAITAIRMGRPVSGIRVRKDATGEVELDPHPLALNASVTALIFLAGPIGSLRAGDTYTAEDLSRRDDILRAKLALDKCAMTAREAVTFACRTVETSWCQIMRVARALRERRELTGLEIIFAMYGRAP